LFRSAYRFISPFANHLLGIHNEPLRNVTTIAADGSQIMSSKDVSVPVGVIQVGWFENTHSSEARYIKDIQVDILTPAELLGADPTDDGSSAVPDLRINIKRFTLEIERLITFMEDKANIKPKPLAFFDGSLIISFAQQLRSYWQKQYSDAVIRLLDTSERTGVPVVGYIDTSYAKDIVEMIAHVTELQLTGMVSDGTMLRQRKMVWGDRSPVFVCDRNDSLEARFYDRVCFTYLKTTASNPPARLDFPRWVYESGEYERVIDLVRAECIVGVGYPYALETADAVAVLTMQDRERFYRLFQRFAEGERLDFRFSRKSVSKRGRR
jgi:hypothetical protein